MQKRKAMRKKSAGNARRILRGIGFALLLVLLFVAGITGGIVAAYSRNLPDISRMADYQPASSTRIFARDGSLLASVYKENRVWVPITRIPPLVSEAFIANEDHNFYSHHGVDFGGIVRAAFADMTHQEFQGASTITQQLARRLFLNDEVSMSRKIQEALLAMEIERYYTKDEILERYLNIIYLGAGAYGVDAAAHTYFGKGVEKLTRRTGGDAGRRRCGAVRLLAVREHEFGARPAASRARSHGRERLHHPDPSRRSLRRAARTRVAARTRIAGLRFTVLHDVSRSHSWRNCSARMPCKKAACRSTRPWIRAWKRSRKRP